MADQQEEDDVLAPILREGTDERVFSPDFQRDVAIVQAMVDPSESRHGTCARPKKYRDPETQKQYLWKPGTAYHTMMVQVQYDRLSRKRERRR